MKRLIGVLAGMMLLWSAAPAGAANRDDPDDVPGSLDLMQVTRTFTNGPSAPPMVHLQATTYEGWTLEECNASDACSFLFEVNALDVFWSVHGTSSGHIRQTCLIFRNAEVIAHGVSTKYRHSVFCSFEKGLVRKDGPVSWRVNSLWGETLDRAPDSGWYGGGAYASSEPETVTA